jgi:hypothetical protein
MLGREPSPGLRAKFKRLDPALNMTSSEYRGTPIGVSSVRQRTEGFYLELEL